MFEFQSVEHQSIVVCLLRQTVVIQLRRQDTPAKWCRSGTLTSTATFFQPCFIRPNLTSSLAFIALTTNYRHSTIKTDDGRLFGVSVSGLCMCTRQDAFAC